MSGTHLASHGSIRQSAFCCRSGNTCAPPGRHGGLLLQRCAFNAAVVVGGTIVPGSAGTLETIARHIGLALQPLEAQLTSQNIVPFLANLGLKFPPQLTAPGPFMTAVQQGSTAAGALPNLLTQLAADISADS